MRTTSQLLLVTFVVSGCVSVPNPAMGVHPSGEPLRVELAQPDDSATPSSPPETVPTIRILQGSTVLDEQDFYQLVGDAKSADFIRTQRQIHENHQVEASLAEALGLSVGALGGLTQVAGVGYLVFGQGTQDQAIVAAAVSVSGFAVALGGVGFGLYNLAQNMAAQRALEPPIAAVFPADQARQAVEDYNRRLVSKDGSRDASPSQSEKP